jgi:hypothetical protein
MNHHQNSSAVHEHKPDSCYHVADSTMTTAQIMAPPHIESDLEGLWLLIKTFGLAEFHCKRFRIRLERAEMTRVPNASLTEF